MRAAMSAAARGVLSILSPSGPRARLSILIYHRVLPQPDPMRPGEPDAGLFEQQMRWLDASFNVLSLREAVHRLRTGTLPARAAAITFDDGYADNREIALPILRRIGLPATVFVATDYLDGGWMFNDIVIEAARQVPAGEVPCHAIGLENIAVEGTADRRALATRVIRELKYRPPGERSRLAYAQAKEWRAQLPESPMMTTGQVRELASNGMELGGHTSEHPILARTDDETAYHTIQAGKKRLEDIVGQSVRLFAYPNGRRGVDYGPEHVDMVARAGFEAAVSTESGVAGAESSIFELPRFTPWDRDQARFLLRMALNARRIRGASGT